MATQDKELTIQEQLESDWCELNYVAKIRDEVVKNFPDMHEKDQEILAQCLVNDSTPITNIIGSVAARFFRLPTASQRQRILQRIIRMAEENHLDIVCYNIVYVRPAYELPKSLQKTKRNFIPPLIMKPKTVRTNEDTGYHVVSKGHLVLGHAANQHSGDICLDIINTQNKSPWRLNAWVLNNTVDEKPENMEQRDWDNFCKETKQIAEFLGTHRVMYLTHRVDKRGRLYCHGYHINYQGNEYHRAMIDLGVGEIVTGSLV